MKCSSRLSSLATLPCCAKVYDDAITIYMLVYAYSDVLMHINVYPETLCQCLCY